MKTGLDKKIEHFDQKIPGTSTLVTNAVFNTKVGERQNKIPDISGLVTNYFLNIKVGEVKNKNQML